MRRVGREGYERLRARAEREWGYVYLLRCGRTSFVKIGWTLKAPGERAREVQAEFRAGFEFRLVAAFFCYNPPAAEEMFHRLLDGQRVTDWREWFAISAEQLRALVGVFGLLEGAGAQTKEAHEKGRKAAYEELVSGAIAELEDAVLNHASYVGYTYEEERHDEGFGGVVEGMWWAEDRPDRMPIPMTRECVIQEIVLETGAAHTDRKGIDYIPDDPWEYLDVLADALDAVGEDGRGLKHEALRPQDFVS
jgi:hypothetical protein